MAEVKWIKITTDMFDNRKIKYLRKLPDGDCIVLIWVMLLTMAGRCNAGGKIYLTEDIPYTPKMLADELDFPENTVILALQALERMNMIVSEDDGFSVVGWEEYQNADKLAEIRAKDRERKRLKRAQAKGELPDPAVSEDVHGHSTDCPHIEEEEETEKEKEFHSFIRSADGEQDDADVDFLLLPPTEEERAQEEAKERTRMRYMKGQLGQGYLFLSQEQFDALLDELSFDEFHKYIGIVVECEKNGKKFKKKSHYQAILDMAKKDRAIKGGAKP